MCIHAAAGSTAIAAAARSASAVPSAVFTAISATSASAASAAAATQSTTRAAVGAPSALATASATSYSKPLLPTSYPASKLACIWLCLAAIRHRRIKCLHLLHHNPPPAPPRHDAQRLVGARSRRPLGPRL